MSSSKPGSSPNPSSSEDREITTLAYKDGVLASDSLATANGNRVSLVTKVMEKNGILFGGSGSLSMVQHFFDWVRGGMEGDPPEMQEGSTYEGVIIVAPTMLLFTPHGLIRRPAGPWWSSGSGWEIAAGAMMAGKSAIEAIEVAIEIDVYSGGPIQAVGAI